MYAIKGTDTRTGQREVFKHRETLEAAQTVAFYAGQNGTYTNIVINVCH